MPPLSARPRLSHKGPAVTLQKFPPVSPWLSGAAKKELLDDVWSPEKKRCNTCGGKKDKVKKTFKLYGKQHQFLEEMAKTFGVKDCHVSDLSRIPLPRPHPRRAHACVRLFSHPLSSTTLSH